MDYKEALKSGALKDNSPIPRVKWGWSLCQLKWKLQGWKFRLQRWFWSR